MFKRILVPTDGTERSANAVKGAAGFAKALGAEIVLVTVIEPYSYTNLSEYRPETIEQYDERVTADAEERLDFAQRLCKDMGVETVRTKWSRASRPRKRSSSLPSSTIATSSSWRATAARGSLPCSSDRKRRRCSRTRRFRSWCTADQFWRQFPARRTRAGKRSLLQSSLPLS